MTRYLRQALRRASSLQSYDERPYQVTAARKSAAAVLDGKHAVLTLPTGTGKTLVCGMAAALYLRERPDERVVFTAPRRTLLSQLRDRSRWLGPTVTTGAVGLDPREGQQRVIAAFDYSKVLFGMPEFLANRIGSGLLEKSATDRIGMLIVDEFDAFLTLRYLARGEAVSFHEPLSALMSALRPECRLLLVSATTPETATTGSGAGDDVELQADISARSAFRRFLDDRLQPTYVTIPERHYSAFIPHACIMAVAVDDAEVSRLADAVEDEVRLLLNWISGAVGAHIDAGYVLPRLAQIRSGRLALWPKGPRISGGGPVSGLLGRLEKMIHLPDFLYEDMARGVDAAPEESWRWTSELDSKMPAQVQRISFPADQSSGAMHAELRGKFTVLENILRARAGERGVMFFRNIRVLESAAARLRPLGVETLRVHGERSPAENERALTRFRGTEACVLLITRDTGKRGLDLPEGDYAIFYSPKAREDVTWQEVSRIRSTVGNPKTTYILFYAGTSEARKMRVMAAALAETGRSNDVVEIKAADL